MCRWHAGWVASRGLGVPEEDDGVLRTVVGDPGRDVERLVLGADQHPRRIDRAASASWADRDPWITVPTRDPGRTADRLVEHGLATAPAPEWLMRVGLAEQRRVELPDDHAVRVQHAAPDAVRLEVVAGAGALAASGQVGVANGWAVPDRITTERLHRRRGLGAAVMTMLVDAARERGATRGVLVASDQGRGLYATLGWQTVGAVVVARRL
ncbi:MAG: family N-acetyltransferase [Marmoricola sp.]|nr:family N-acetyltransferase [Marmoricola sp.]